MEQVMGEKPVDVESEGRGERKQVVGEALVSVHPEGRLSK